MGDLKLYSKSEKALNSLIQIVRILVKTLECDLGLINMPKVKSDDIQLPNDKVSKSLKKEREL